MRFISFLCLFLPLSIADNSNNFNCSFGTPTAPKASPKELAKLEFRLYTGETLEDYIKVRIGKVLELCDNIDNSKPTLLYIFGFRGYPEDPSTEAITNAYLARQDHNILLYDWSIVSLREITFAQNSATGVGIALAKAIENLTRQCLDTSNLHIVGFSLGAVIGGVAGRTVKSQLYKIIGLDPAGPGYGREGIPLNTGDAENVYILHTDGRALGNDLRSGHANFYINGGYNPQPGCKNAGEGWYKDTCSHYLVCYIYAESVRNENSIIGVECNSYSEYMAGLCNSNSTAVVGYNTPDNVRGKFYVQTKNEEFYRQGLTARIRG